jgi:hypothetical protein
MSNITVAEILKIHGNWIKSKDFIQLVSEKLAISERMAYLKIKEAIEKKEILKIPLPDRTVLYGLAEFGLPNVQQIHGIFDSLAKKLGLTKEELLHLFELGIIYGEDDF